MLTLPYCSLGCSFSSIKLSGITFSVTLVWSLVWICLNSGPTNIWIQGVHRCRPDTTVELALTLWIFFLSFLWTFPVRFPPCCWRPQPLWSRIVMDRSDLRHSNNKSGDFFFFFSVDTEGKRSSSRKHWREFEMSVLEVTVFQASSHLILVLWSLEWTQLRPALFWSPETSEGVVWFCVRWRPGWGVTQRSPML